MSSRIPTATSSPVSCFPEPVTELKIEVDLVADMTVYNPFDFFVEPSAETYPFEYPEDIRDDLEIYRTPEPAGPLLKAFLERVDHSHTNTVNFVVALNAQVQREIGYIIRMETGVMTPEETLGAAKGSCRDSSWLLVQALRNLGIAARFVSGYLIQLKPDLVALDGPAGTAVDFTDLHAWCEVYIPGAGWIGLDPTSGLLTGESHVPLAARRTTERRAISAWQACQGRDVPVRLSGRYPRRPEDLPHAEPWPGLRVCRRPST